MGSACFSNDILYGCYNIDKLVTKCTYSYYYFWLLCTYIEYVYYVNVTKSSHRLRCLFTIYLFIDNVLCTDILLIYEYTSLIISKYNDTYTYNTWV